MLLYSTGRQSECGFNPLVPSLLPIGRRTYFFSMRCPGTLATVLATLGIVGICALPLFLYGTEYVRVAFILSLFVLGLIVKFQPKRQFVVENTLPEDFRIAPWYLIASWTFMWLTYGALFWIATWVDGDGLQLALGAILVPTLAALLPVANVALYKGYKARVRR